MKTAAPKSRLARLLVLACVLPLSAALTIVSPAAAATLTKDDVIRMAKSGQSEQAILEAIKESHATFDLTADDVADLRAVGVGDKVIDAMLATAPAPTEGASGAAESKGSESKEPQSQETPPDQEAYPPPIAYPVYPLYYPVYYPVYDPFFPFFGGFFFSFEFVHVSRLFTVFPFDRVVIVVSQPLVLGRTSLRGTTPVVFSTPRTLPRGSTGAMRTSLSPRGSVSARTSPMIDPQAARGARSRPLRLAGTVSPHGAVRPAVPRGPRWQAAAPAGRPVSRPPFQTRPRAFAPSFRPPRPAPLPRGGFAPMRSFGGPRGFGAPRSGGGGHAHTGGHGGHH